MNTAILFSSAKDDWQTPRELFDELNAEFDFNVDLAATAENTLCDEWFDERRGGALNWPWAPVGRTGFCNPPYSRGLQKKFIEKAATERLSGFTTVMLIPARTDTKAFHRYIWNAETHQPREGVEVRFLPGRIRFVGAAHGAPFPSMIIVFRGAAQESRPPQEPRG
jgi:phage N-6-adenine-methyltransferase